MAKKKMGRPLGKTHDRPMQLRVNADFLAMLDAWCEKQTQKPNRSEAIRQLVRTAIAADCLARKRGK